MNISIVTCVNDFQLYDKLVKSLEAKNNFHLISVDNTRNRYSIPVAYNSALKNAQSDVIVFVHQDVIFPENWHERIENQIRQVEGINQNWGILGVMGVKKCGRFAGHIIDPHTKHIVGLLPSPVATLDEVCLIFRKSSGLSFDEELGGYHFYGADICLQAMKKGFTCYAIDACLTHLSGGIINNHFYEMAEKLKTKWRHEKMSPMCIETTCGVFTLKDGLIPIIISWYMRLRRKMWRKVQGRRYLFTRSFFYFAPFLMLFLRISDYF